MSVYRFKFDESIDKEFIDSQIGIAIITAECIFGQAKVRLNAGYLVVKNKVAIDGSGEVGEFIAQVFTGLLIHFLGEEKFTVERVKKKE